ncbi:sugar transferase [Robertkochia aurantiaca]|uniref:sugar transferase n=1 Tax=Robertkochia aurantiaca TaxID=2873700 RepID=UPI001CCFC9A0
MYKNSIKRVFDLIVSILAFLVLFPIFILVLFILLFANEGKPFFLQKRPGLNGKLFRIIKFKTMNDKKDSNGNLLPNKDRITPFGGFIRKTSLDELPQLINVIKGDMSLVGPRPLLPEYLPLYDDFQARRHEVRPGITGWAQVNGRNAISWEEKFAYDVWYVENCSLYTDLKTLWLTVLKVLKADGVSASPSVTMERFTGSKT